MTLSNLTAHQAEAYFLGKSHGERNHLNRRVVNRSVRIYYDNGWADGMAEREAFLKQQEAA